MNQLIYSEAVEKSLCSGLNNYRLKNVLEDDSRNELTIGFLGGSVTEGWSGEYIIEENYSVILFNYLCSKYPDKKFSYVNLSMASENSFLGLSMTEKYLSSENPDIVIVEYAVNNECGKDHIISYESLICRLLKMPSQPAVISVFMLNSSYYTCQAYMKLIGAHYKIPMVSVADALKYLLDTGEIEWNRYAADFAHATEWGHRFIGDCVINLFDRLHKSKKDEKLSLGSPLYSADFAEYKLIDTNQYTEITDFRPVSDIQYFDRAVGCSGKSDKAVIRFTADFKHLFVVYMHDREPRYADADIIIDSKHIDVLPGTSIYGWNNTVMKNVCNFDECITHHVEIRPRKGKPFVVAEIGICI